MQAARKKTSPLQFVALLLVFSISFFIGKFIADWGFFEEPQTPQTAVREDDKEISVKRLNILLMGIDARPGEKDARTDSLILVSIDRDTKKMAMVSIPRDTLVDIPGHGKNKINAANVFGGADLARSTVEDLLGVQVPYYMKTNFEGFQEIVDTLGGVEIDVDKRMYYPSEKINLKPGLQKLDGAKALGYVRFRHDALGDIGRTERQQKFLSALAKEMLRARAIIKAPVLVPQLMKAVETNLGVKDAIFTAQAVSKLDSDNIVTATLPGTFYNYKGTSYWKIDDSKARVVLNDLFSGYKVATITGPDINVPREEPKKEVPPPVTEPEDNKVPAEGAEGEIPDVSITPVDEEQTGDQKDPGTGGSTPDQPGNDAGQSGQQPPGTTQPGQTPPGQTPDGGQGGQTPPPPTGTTPPGTVVPTEPETDTNPDGTEGQTGTTGSTGSTTSTLPKMDIITQG